MKKFIKKYVYPLVITYRIPSVVRISLDIRLKQVLRKLHPGRVLDVGARFSPYKKWISYTEYNTLDIDPSNKPDLCCDLHDMTCKDNEFDTIIATEVLEHLYNPETAAKEMYRVLKPGGVCVASTRFFHHFHPDPKDYFRFTKHGLEHIFRDFSHVEVHPHGCRWSIVWHVINTGRFKMVGNLLNPLLGRINPRRTNMALGFVVYAKK